MLVQITNVEKKTENKTGGQKELIYHVSLKMDQDVDGDKLVWRTTLHLKEHEVNVKNMEFFQKEGVAFFIDQLFNDAGA